MVREIKIDGIVSVIEYNDRRIFDETSEASFYEQPMLDAIRKLDRWGIYLDVGANVGNHSVFFAEHCNSVIVMAFEPNRSSFELLKKNTAGKRKPVLVNNLAVGSVPKNVKVIQTEHAGSSYVIEAESGIQMVTLNDWLYGVQYPVAVLKIDVEGDEIDVLTGALEIIEKDKPDVFIETWDKVNEIEAILAPYCYELKERYNHAPTYHFSVNDKIPKTYTP